MRQLKTILATAAIIGLAACAAPTNDTETVIVSPPIKTEPVRPNIEAKENLRAEDRAACKAAGGIVGRAGMINWEHCVFPYSDAEKVCSDNSECEGQCQYIPPMEEVSASEASDTVTGTCQVNTLPFGCYSQVKNGKATHMLCVD